MFEDYLHRFESWKPQHFFKYLGAIAGGLAGGGFGIDYDVVNFAPTMLQSPEELLIRGVESLATVALFGAAVAFGGRKLGSMLDQAIESPDG